MHQETNEEKNKKLTPNAFISMTKNDVYRVENPQTYSSIGKIAESTKKSAPEWKFGKAGRNDSQRMYFSKVLIKNQLINKGIDPPLYHPHIDNKFIAKPKWSFSKGNRESENKPPYDFYTFRDTKTNVTESFQKVIRNCGAVRFGSDEWTRAAGSWVARPRRGEGRMRRR